ADAEGRWTPENTDADKPRAFSYVGEYWRSNDGRNTYWLRSADYIRLKNAEIGYNMPLSVTEKLGMSGLRIFLSGSNLLTFCPDISDFDPESTSTYWDYPLHKVINIGVTVNF
ncbi:MAG: TonB-dependent receptor, partial [Prolixibacteraceae bacterium]|nr:TonB-dependent receptor [Prolixibacteraceae bacterium]